MFQHRIHIFVNGQLKKLQVRSNGRIRILLSYGMNFHPQMQSCGAMAASLYIVQCLSEQAKSRLPFRNISTICREIKLGSIALRTQKRHISIRIYDTDCRKLNIDHPRRHKSIILCLNRLLRISFIHRHVCRGSESSMQAWRRHRPLNCREGKYCRYRQSRKSLKFLGKKKNRHGKTAAKRRYL